MKEVFQNVNLLFAVTGKKSAVREFC
jgi:hypothetical protein